VEALGALFLSALLIAGPASATDLAPSLQVLEAEGSTPLERAEHLERLCDPGRSLEPDGLVAAVRGLLLSELRPARLAGARLAACRTERELIPTLYWGFQRERSSTWTDPDVYERLLRALQAHPISVVREELDDPEHGLGGAVHGELLDRAWTRLSSNWLEPLSQGKDMELTPRLGPEANELALAEAGEWLERVLSMGPDGLVRLQSDSGDHAFQFVERLQGWHLAAMISSGTGPEAKLATEVCAQSGLCDVTTEDPASIAAPLRPVVPLDVPPATAEQLLEPPMRWPLSVLALLAAGLFWLGWALAARARPSWRRGLFPLGAVALAPTLLLLAELGLAAAGVQPLAWTSDGGWSEPVAMRGLHEGSGMLLEEQELGGEEWLTVINGSSRWASIRRSKAEGTWRIVALGESSVQAANYLAEESFVSVLGRRLQASHPERSVEVLNGGIGGAISDDVVRAGRDALAADADLLILYHGVNDLGRLETLASLRAFTPFQLSLRVFLDESRVARVISDLLPDALLERWGAPEDDGAQLDPEQDGESVDLRPVAALRCTRNQQRLVLEANAQGVPVIVVAQALFEPEADEAPSRADDEELLVWIAEETAARTGATLMGGQAVFRSHAEAATGEARAGRDYFWDGLHPSRLGHAVLGEALAPTAERLLLER